MAAVGGNERIDVTIAVIKSPLMMLWLTQRLSEKVFDGVL
jgi:hypothetical protein